MGIFNEYIDQNKDRFSATLQKMRRQKSPGVQDVKGKGMRKMARMIKKQLKKVGAKCSILGVTNSPPVVYAEIGGGKRILLIYNHYDVWPAESFEKCDNKVSLMASIFALEAWQKTFGNLPLKIKFVIEGEGTVRNGHFQQSMARYVELFGDYTGCLGLGNPKSKALKLLCQEREIQYKNMHVTDFIVGIKQIGDFINDFAK